MSDIVIHAESIGKMYHRGAKQGGPTSIRDVFSSFWPFGRRGASLVSHAEEEFWALRDVSFEVERGEVIGIVGCNGSGKSTLLKILSRITRPTEGRVQLRGRIASLLEVGTGFHPELTGRENIYLNGVIIGMSRSEIARKFDEIVAFSGIEPFLDTPVKHYSSGMYVRLAFAVSAHLDADLLLVDEVLAVGDMAFQRKCLDRMHAAKKEGRTVLFVSHGMSNVNKLCTRAILLEAGRCKMQGIAQEVTEQYVVDNTPVEEVAAPKPVIELPENSADAVGRGLSLEILSADDQPQISFTVGQPWRVRLHFEMFKPTQSVVAAIGLMTIDGTPITTIWSNAVDLNPGRYRVDFDVDVPLAPCRLRMVFGLSSYLRTFCYAEDLGLVNIEKDLSNTDPVASLGGGLLKTTIRPDVIAVDTGNLVAASRE